METSQMVSKEGMWPLVCGFLFSDANIFLTIKIFKEMHIVIITLYHNHTKKQQKGDKILGNFKIVYNMFLEPH